LRQDDLAFTNSALQVMIRSYTWEAGVRNLEREIGKICRRVARRKAEGKSQVKRIQANMLSRLLGPPQILPHELEPSDAIGAATGLAWTENGGDLLTVEALLVEGKGGLQITGQLGDVMQESAQAALSYVKSLADKLDFDVDIFDKTDIHIHVPEGSIPKDGPSAGITMATALASAISGRPVLRDVGMSGEITLRGRVLPIGGVREKLHVAHRLDLKTIILPTRNKKDLEEIPRRILNKLDLILVDTMDEVLDIALKPAIVKKKASTTKKKGQAKQPRGKKSK
jgi:ATP-dependent Lon protease